MKIKKEEMSVWINSRRFMYAASPNIHNRYMVLYFTVGNNYIVEEATRGFGGEPTVLYEGDDIDKAIRIFNDLVD